MYKIKTLELNSHGGQALITLLFFIIIALTVIATAVVVILTSSISASNLEIGTDAYYAAEAGIENALLNLERNSAYTGETLQIGSATVAIQVTAGNPITILSVATQGNFIRKIQAQAVYNNTMLSVSSWKEVN